MTRVGLLDGVHCQCAYGVSQLKVIDGSVDSGGCACGLAHAVVPATGTDGISLVGCKACDFNTRINPHAVVPPPPVYDPSQALGTLPLLIDNSMPPPRFYCQTPLAGLSTVTLPIETAHHVNVLRLASGQDIVLFDGTGGEYACTLRFEGKQAIADIQAHCKTESELAGHLTLVQGLAGADKMDWIIEKAVELGVSAIMPVSAKRSVLQLKGPRLEKRMLHWRRIIQSASEQCGRNRLAELYAPATLAQALAALATAPGQLTLLCDPAATKSLKTCLAEHTPPRAVSLLVGPEGGWTPEETSIALEKGAVAVQYGARILRTETAGLTLITAVSTLCGWT